MSILINTTRGDEVIVHVYTNKYNMKGWVDKSSYCSCRVDKIPSQHPLGSSQPSVT